MWLRYLGEVEYTDHFIGQLLDVLESLGLDDETVVVLAVDHGEGFDHAHYFGHGNRLYDTLVHVPLIVRWPGGPPPAVVDRQVELIDLNPSIVAMLGLEQDIGLFLGKRPDFFLLPAISLLSSFSSVFQLDGFNVLFLQFLDDILRDFS